MLNTVLYVALGLFVALFIFYAYETYRLRKKAKSRLEEIEWSLSQLERALSLIQTNDKDPIFTGLHILSVINHPSRLRALPRLMELTGHEDQRIADSAKTVIEKMGYSAPPPLRRKEKVYANAS